MVGEDGEEVIGDDNDDFVVQRRDVSAGRPVMSGPVLYSVAESVAQPRWATLTHSLAFCKCKCFCYVLALVRYLGRLVAFLRAHRRRHHSLLSSGRPWDEKSFDRERVYSTAAAESASRK